MFENAKKSVKNCKKCIFLAFFGSKTPFSTCCNSTKIKISSFPTIWLVAKMVSNLMKNLQGASYYAGLIKKRNMEILSYCWGTLFFLKALFLSIGEVVFAKCRKQHHTKLTFSETVLDVVSKTYMAS